ncbi:MAG TPA: glycosyltransferase family 4 protein [Gemmatimonadales bacterium]|nr:glycosyltransferase family 4 protein [Gemmatimonadales bacterium]
MTAPPLLIDWPVNTATGWGVFGLNLTLQLLRQGRHPALLMAPDLADCSPVAQALLHQCVLEQQQLAGMLRQSGAGLDCAFPVLRGLDGNFQPHPVSTRVQARRNIGVLFFEDTTLPPEALERAARHQALIAGSGWNAELLRQRGLTNVHLIPQGIDPAAFHPGPRSGLLDQRFVVFSGGKLEFRKGQDLVVAAFRQFVRRHPDALLLAAWHNAWPATMTGIELTGHVKGLPRVDQAGRLLTGEWLVANGIPAGTFVEVGPLPNWAIAPLYRDADLALFPNRAEGGTNLVAMEAMACGVPAILSSNTGHLDLVHPSRTFALTRQAPVKGGCPLYRGYEGWGESDVDEILALMEAAYANRDEARRRGQAAAAHMQAEWTWAKRVGELLEVVDGVAAPRPAPVQLRM